MSVVIRMKRAGAKKRPFYRVVVADSRSARDGRYIEQLGYYDPLTDPAKFQIDAVKFEQWIRKGAKPSESVEVMMAKHAPSALRPAPLPRLVPDEAEGHAAGAAAKVPKAKKAKKAKAKPLAKAARKPRTATKASQKKAKTKAKAKARKASGVAKPGRTKKAKKSKK
jgi:small subunit ribosomal protein S16